MPLFDSMGATVNGMKINWDKNGNVVDVSINGLPVAKIDILSDKEYKMTMFEPFGSEVVTYDNKNQPWKHIEKVVSIWWLGCKI